MTAPAQANDSAARQTKLIAVLVLYQEVTDNAKRTVIGHNNFHLFTHPVLSSLVSESAYEAIAV